MDDDAKTIELLTEIAEAEDKLAIRVARKLGARASDVIDGSRKIAAECRVRARHLANAQVGDVSVSHA